MKERVYVVPEWLRGDCECGACAACAAGACEGEGTYASAASVMEVAVYGGTLCRPCAVEAGWLAPARGAEVNND